MSVLKQRNLKVPTTFFAKKGFSKAGDFGKYSILSVSAAKRPERNLKL